MRVSVCVCVCVCVQYSLQVLSCVPLIISCLFSAVYFYHWRVACVDWDRIYVMLHIAQHTMLHIAQHTILHTTSQCLESPAIHPQY